MKNTCKRTLAALLALILAALPLAGLAEAAKPPRKLTLMVYLCGSNLESAYGSASSDIQEMLDAGGAGENATVLLMTGGTHQWMKGYDPGQCQIHELGFRGIRTVWKSEAMSMGSSATLTQLLRFGAENYPADDYALILWDHGGGPLEGVCWDELFSLDNLTLEELKQGIGDADLGRKLSWIGFDACLMGSLEVAAALAPCADYMIASQETEPAAGWNYAFLSGLSQDADPVQTAKRIVDGYMENEVLEGETLTLACLDLSRAKAAMDALGDCFAPRALAMSADSFVELAGKRTQATAFGAPLKAFGDGGYDLVDLEDLVRRLAPGDNAAAALEAALGELVVYSRSNREGVNGVSVYHPCYNKEKYRVQWRENYKRLSFNPAYTRYIDTYGRFLLEDQLADWSGLPPVEAGAPEDGSQTFSLRLNPDQARTFASAQLLLLMGTKYVKGMGGAECYSLVGAFPAVLGEDGMLTATCDSRSLYLEAAGQDTYGPLGYYVSKEDELVTSVTYIPRGGGIGSDGMLNVYYYVAAGEDDRARITQVRVGDSATGMLTNRAAFSEDDYRGMYLWYPLKDLPEADGRGLLPEYALWDDSQGMLMWSTATLPAEWHFEVRHEQRSDNELWAVFEVTDVQQNAWCTPPVPADNPNLVPVGLDRDVFETGEARLTVQAVLDTSANPGVRLDFNLENLTPSAKTYSLRDFTLNGKRLLDDVLSFWDEENQTMVSVTNRGWMYMDIPPKNLAGLGTLDTLEFTLLCQEDRETVSQERVTLNLRDCDVGAVAPDAGALASASQDGFVWQLLSLTPDYYGVEMVLRVENVDGQAGSLLRTRALVNGTYQLLSDEFISLPEQGRDTVLTIKPRTRNHLSSIGDNFLLDDTATSVVEYYTPDILREAGLGEISRVDLLIGDGFGPSLSPVPLRLNAPFILPREEPTPDDLFTTITPLYGEDGAQPGLLARSGPLEAWVDRLVLGKNGLCLTLTLRNPTDHTVTFALGGGRIDGMGVDVGQFDFDADRKIVAGATTKVIYALGRRDENVLPEGLPVGELALGVRWGDASELSWATLRCPEGAALSAPGGMAFSADELEIEPAALEGAPGD